MKQSASIHPSMPEPGRAKTVWIKPVMTNRHVTRLMPARPTSSPRPSRVGSGRVVRNAFSQLRVFIPELLQPPHRERAKPLISLLAVAIGRRADRGPPADSRHRHSVRSPRQPANGAKYERHRLRPFATHAAPLRGWRRAARLLPAQASPSRKERQEAVSSATLRACSRTWRVTFQPLRWCARRISRSRAPSRCCSASRICSCSATARAQRCAERLPAKR